MNGRISASKMHDTKDRRRISILFMLTIYELHPFGLVIWYYF